MNNMLRTRNSSHQPRQNILSLHHNYLSHFYEFLVHESHCKLQCLHWVLKELQSSWANTFQKLSVLRIITSQPSESLYYLRRTEVYPHIPPFTPVTFFTASNFSCLSVYHIVSCLMRTSTRFSHSHYINTVLKPEASYTFSNSMSDVTALGNLGVNCDSSLSVIPSQLPGLLFLTLLPIFTISLSILHVPQDPLFWKANFILSLFLRRTIINY